ncbi:hypothetical protein H4R35_001517 [Dimargaris xerosporica]|nr:hypothetical protein H4R35_001517 [Dimargaris xerosporica]
MPMFELLYFPISGLGEVARSILDYADADWANKYATNWEHEKPLTPYGKVPVLYEHLPNGETFVLPESRAIERYLAIKFDLYGSTAHENALLDSYISQLDEVALRLMISIAGKEELRAPFKELFQQAADHLFTKHGEILTKNGTGHYLGDQTTWADLSLYFLFTKIRDTGFYSDSLKAKAAPIEKLASTLEQDPNVQRYLQRLAVRKANEYKQ